MDKNYILGFLLVARRFFHTSACDFWLCRKMSFFLLLYSHSLLFGHTKLLKFKFPIQNQPVNICNIISTIRDQKSVVFQTVCYHLWPQQLLFAKTHIVLGFLASKTSSSNSAFLVSVKLTADFLFRWLQLPVSFLTTVVFT